MANNVVDGFWLLSCFLFIDLIWANNYIKWWFIMGMFVFAIFLELLQYVEICSGTSDIWDIMSYVTALTILIGIIKMKTI